MSDKEWRTIHGCRCKKKYKIGTREFDGRQCVYGGNDGSGGKKGTCPPVKDFDKLSKHCIRDAYRQRCIVEEQGKCGYRGVDWGGELNKDENWDYCRYSGVEELSGSNAGVGAPLYKHPVKNIIGLVILILLFCIIFPVIIYYISNNFLLSLVFIMNLPLFATTLGFRNGLFGSRYFAFVYRELQETLFEKISRIIIHCISLLALLCIILTISLRDYKKHKFNMIKLVGMVLVYFVTTNGNINYPKLYADHDNRNKIDDHYGRILPHVYANTSQIRYFLRYSYSKNAKKHPHDQKGNTAKSIMMTLLMILVLTGIESALLLKL